MSFTVDHDLLSTIWPSNGREGTVSGYLDFNYNISSLLVELERRELKAGTQLSLQLFLESSVFIPPLPNRVQAAIQIIQPVTMMVDYSFLLLTSCQLVQSKSRRVYHLKVVTIHFQSYDN
jgi:hypothetical protein